MSELNSTNAWPFTEIPAEEGLDINAIFGDSTDTANQGNPVEAQAAAAAPAPAPAPAEEEQEEELADDGELVAVIAAAIAAYDGSTSTDGFVVRSIKRSKTNKWKRA